MCELCEDAEATDHFDHCGVYHVCKHCLAELMKRLTCPFCGD